MKRILALTLGLCFGLSTAALAHPAQSVKLTIVGNQLQADISHSVRNLADHYIDEAVVSVNGQTLLEEKYPAQSANDFQLTFALPELKAGDVIAVLTKCNKGGDKIATITLEQDLVSVVAPMVEEVKENVLEVVPEVPAPLEVPMEAPLEVPAQEAVVE